jgi:hypothetical protein
MYTPEKFEPTFLCSFEGDDYHYVHNCRIKLLLFQGLELVNSNSNSALLLLLSSKSKVSNSSSISQQWNQSYIFFTTT